MPGRRGAAAAALGDLAEGPEAYCAQRHNPAP